MKRSMMSVCVALAMIFALPALADASEQRAQDRESTEVDTSTDDQGSEYTDPKSDAHAPAGSRTIKGEFVKKTDRQLWIKTGTGTETIQLTNQTAMPENPPQEGDRLVVSYERTTQGVMVANSVRAASPKVDRGQVTISQSEQTEGERESTADAATESGEFEDTESSQERMASRQRLPQTATELPLVALLGLLAIGGAVAIRFAR